MKPHATKSTENTPKPFEFIKPEHKHQKDLNKQPILTSTLTCVNVSSGTQIKALFGLHGKLLVQYENEFSKKPHAILNLDSARIKALSLNEFTLNFGFAIVMNKEAFELLFADEKMCEKWNEALKSVCILTNFCDEYKKIKVIGKGTFAKVFLIKSRKNGKFYAAKAFSKESFDPVNKLNSKAALKNEIELIKALNHPNIIQLYEVHETENTLYLVMELIQGKSLQEILSNPIYRKDYSEEKMTAIFHSILKAMAYIASKGIMHRDLKPENILIDKEGNAKIVDLGLATYIDTPEYIFKRCGSPGYMAPEVFAYDEKKSESAYNDRCDVFSAGCILFFMLFERPCFEGYSGSQVLYKNRNPDRLENILTTIEDELDHPNSPINKQGLTLLLSLLKPSQKLRISAAEALESPYFNSVSIKPETSECFEDDILDEFAPSMTIKSIKIPHLMTTTIHDIPESQIIARFKNENSLYLDIGKPEMTGRLETMATISGANSPVTIRLSNLKSNGSSLVGTLIEDSDSFQKRAIFGGRSARTNKTLKVSIYSNMQKTLEANSAGIQFKTISNIHTEHKERRHSEELRSGLGIYNEYNDESQEMEDVGDECSNVQVFFEKFKKDEKPYKNLGKMARFN